MQKKCIQFKLWDDCNNHCTFCYLNKTRKNTSQEEKLNRLNVLKDRLYSLDLNKYDRVGLIGGDFYLGELNGLENVWIDILKQIDSMNLSTYWIASALTQPDPSFLLDSLKDLNKSKVLICTSYDTVGRFTENKLKNWKSNINILLEKGYNINITAIPTEDFLNEYKNSFFPEQCEINLCEPHLGTEWYCEADKENYNAKLVKENTLFNLPSRSEFIKFITNNPKILKNYVNYSNNHSNDIIDFDEHISYEMRNNRLDKTNLSANAPCGHPHFCKFYRDSNKCAMCDAMDIYNSLEEN